MGEATVAAYEKSAGGAVEVVEEQAALVVCAQGVDGGENEGELGAHGRDLA
ncbi:hypothetical protein ACFWN5_19640 [Streptomyces sp. NPDC058430]|uniref:hypothetical protein n=1 Tax=Streptomyces sp. NPDC058430 TaxID=3346495 RepID=UPI00364D47C7